MMLCSAAVEDPVQWSSTRKWTVVALLWLASTIPSLSSTAFEPALPIVAQDLGTDNGPLETFTISIYLIGYCLGPLLISPAIEVYGRAPTTFTAVVGYMVALAVCGSSSSIAVFTVFRLLMGVAGIALIICGSAVVADIMPLNRRGLAQALLTSAQTLGPTLGPLMGGYIAQNVSWRWIFWVGLIAMGIPLAGLSLVLKETYRPVLERRQRAHASKGSHPESDQSRNSSTSSPAQALVIRHAWTRIFRYLFRTRLIPLFALYTSWVNANIFILLTTLGTSFETSYSFHSGSGGLSYLGMAVGFGLGQLSLGLLSDARVSRRSRDKIGAETAIKTKEPAADEGMAESGDGGSTAKPEDRLPPIIFGSILTLLSLIFYGWTLQKQVTWIAPIIASGLVAFGTMYTYIPVQIYVIDAFTLHTASVTGALTVVRSAASAAVPVAATPLYARFGYGWGFTLLAGIAVPFIIFSLALVRWGEKIRRLDTRVQ